MKFLVLILFIVARIPPLQAQEFSRTDTTFDVQHYTLHIRPDIQTGNLDGECRIHLVSATPELRSIALDAADMAIHAVTASDGRGLVYEYDSVKLFIELAVPISDGDSIGIHISYSTSLSKGMYFVRPDASFPNNPMQWFTHNQPDDARHWFPCHDVPWDKATFDISITADSDLDVVANGTLVHVRPATPAQREWRYRMEKPISTYLAAAAGGVFQKHDVSMSGTPPLEGWAPTDTPEEIMQATYNATGDMLHFFERYTGVPYPWNKYVQVPLRNFPYGGMENVSLTFLAENEVLLDLRARQDYTDQPLIAHELAHQWWGNLVTCYDWEDLWINEGFATYFQQLWTRESLGRAEFEFQQLQGIENILRYQDGDAPLPVRAKSKNASQNLYSKGAAIFSMLSDMMGEERFKAAISHNLTKRGFSTVTASQLQADFEHSSGLRLDAFFHTWLYRTDYPIVKVGMQWLPDAGQLQLRVSQQSSAGRDDAPFPIPLAFATPGLPASRFLLTTMDTVWSLPHAKQPTFLERAGFVPMRLEMQETPEELVAKLEQGASVSARIGAAEKLVPFMHIPAARAALLWAGADDSFYGVRFRITRAFSEIALDTAAYRDDIISFFEGRIHDSRSSVRATALNGLSRLRDPDYEKVFRTALADESYHVEAAALNALVLLGVADTEALLRNRLRSKSYKDILAKAALTQVAESGMRTLAAEVRVLAGPGNALGVRFEALKALIRIETESEMFLALLRSMLDEPLTEVRYMGMSALASRFPDEAVGLFQSRLEVETNASLRILLREYHRGE